MTALLTFGAMGSARRRIARVPLLFRARDCEDEDGIFALSYGKRVGLVHTRAGATGVAAVYDRDGRIAWVPAAKPRLSWVYAHVGGSAARVRALLMEPAGANQQIHSEDFSSWSDFNSCTVTTNALRAPDGRLTADLLTATSTISARRMSNPGLNVAGRAAVGVWMHGGTSPNSEIKYVDVTAGGAVRRQLRINWLNGVPGYIDIAGQGEQIGPEPGPDGWWRVGAAMDDVSGVALTEVLEIYPDVTGGTGSVYAWGATLEEESSLSSYMRSGGAAGARAADAAYFLFNAVPQAMTAYVRFVELSPPPFPALSGSSARILRISDSLTPPYFDLYRAQLTTNYGVSSHDGAALQIATRSGSAVTQGSLVEQMGTLRSDGRLVCTLAVDGSVPSESAPSTALTIPGSWTNNHLSLTAVGLVPTAYQSVVVASGEVSIDDCRELCEVA